MPDHTDTNPSFSILDKDTGGGVYNCFGCGAMGNQKTFVRATKPERWPALYGKRQEEFFKALSNDYVTVAAPSPASAPTASAVRTGPNIDAGRADRGHVSGAFSREDIIAVNEAALDAFRTNLRYGYGQQDALEYLYLDRGLTRATIRHFGIGYAPSSRFDETIARIGRKGISIEAMKAAGIVKIGERGSPYSVYRDRIMIPWRDAKGNTVGFGARLLPGRKTPATRRGGQLAPKYLNSPTTPAFAKGKTLFNLDKATLGNKGPLLVVEGYFDVISLHQAGIEKVVSPIGVALSKEQLAILWEKTDSPIICLDGDEAGSAASIRVAKLAQSIRPEGKTLRFAFLPDGKDPDEIVRKEGAEAFERAIATLHTLEQVLERHERSIREANTAPDGAGEKGKAVAEMANEPEATSAGAAGKRKASVDSEPDAPSTKRARIEPPARPRDRSTSR